MAEFQEDPMGLLVEIIDEAKAGNSEAIVILREKIVDLAEIMHSQWIIEYAEFMLDHWRRARREEGDMN